MIFLVTPFKRPYGQDRSHPNVPGITQRKKMDEGITDLYVCSVEDEIVYVGISNDSYKRQKKHKRASWWTEATEFSVVETFPTRAEARAHEAELIRILNPPFNKQG